MHIKSENGVQHEGSTKSENSVQHEGVCYILLCEKTTGFVWPWTFTLNVKTKASTCSEFELDCPEKDEQFDGLATFGFVL